MIPRVLELEQEQELELELKREVEDNPVYYKTDFPKDWDNPYHCSIFAV
jgi:hypothetical protein